MTDKRFRIIADYPNELGIEDKISGDVVVLTHRNLNSESFVNQVCYLLNELHEKKELWKRECKRLKGLYYLENENVRLEDIIGLVKTDEPTNSVELKKELYK